MKARQVMKRSAQPTTQARLRKTSSSICASSETWNHPAGLDPLPPVLDTSVLSNEHKGAAPSAAEAAVAQWLDEELTADEVDAMVKWLREASRTALLGKSVEKGRSHRPSLWVQGGVLPAPVRRGTLIFGWSGASAASSRGGIPPE